MPRALPLELELPRSELSALTELPIEEVAVTLRVATPDNVEALARFAGVPDAFVPTFAAAIAALRSERGFADKTGPVRVNQDVLTQLKALIAREDLDVHQALRDRMARLEAEVQTVPATETAIEAEKIADSNVTPFRRPGARDAA